MKIFILLYVLLLLLLEAMTDSFVYKKKNFLSHLLKAILILTFLLMPLLVKPDMVFLFIVSYISIRFALFNYMFNFLSGLDWFYLSKEVIPDKYLTRVPVFHMLFMQFIFLLLGVTIIINEF